MRIFIAGATGAIGRPLVSLLISKGHRVFGMSRSREKMGQIASSGGEPILADALNEALILKELKTANPDVVVEMLTSLPKEYTPQAMREASERNKRVRLEGGGNLQKAAQAVGAKRYIIQSSAFWYAPGQGLATEDTPFAFHASSGISAGTQVYAQMETRVLEAKNMESVVLRFGFFYGPGTWYAPDRNMAERVRNGNYPIVGDGQGVWNFVHIEDAANGIALSLSCKPGIYNITNDNPLRVSQWLPAYARWLGAPSPSHRTIEQELSINGPDSVYYATQLRGASNAKAKKELGFTARPLEWMGKL